MNEEEFNELWNELVDWVGSGFRYDRPELTVEGLGIIKFKLQKFYKDCFQAGVSSTIQNAEGFIERGMTTATVKKLIEREAITSTIAKIRAGSPNKYNRKDMCDDCKHIIYEEALCKSCSKKVGFNQAVDLIEKNIKDVENEH